MRAMLLSGLVLALALAGCAGKDGATPPASEGGEAEADLPDDVRPYAGNATELAAALVPHSGTLHLLDRPAVTIAAPPAGDPLRVRIWSTVDELQGNLVGMPAPPPSWEFTWPGQGKGIVANGTFWVEVQGPVPPSANSCFWDLALTFEIDDSSFYGYSACAGFEGYPVASGPHRIDFEFRFTGTDIPAGSRATMQLYGGTGPDPPGTDVALLTGSAEYDSQITFQGQEFT